MGNKDEALCLKHLKAWAEQRPRFSQAALDGQCENLPRTVCELFDKIQSCEEEICRNVVILHRIESVLKQMLTNYINEHAILTTVPELTKEDLEYIESSFQENYTH